MGSLRLTNRSKALYSGPRGMHGDNAMEFLLSGRLLAMVRVPQPRRFYTSFGIDAARNEVFLGIERRSERADGEAVGILGYGVTQNLFQVSI
jgi:hypothetical protein